MKLLKASVLRKLSVDFGMFMIFSVVITFLSNKVPEKLYYYKKWIYKEREWERGGKFYQDKFNVRRWKKYIPELADFIKSVFPKKYIKGYDEEHISKYLTESCKAELTHWAIILSSLLFLLWKDFWPAMRMLVIAILLNLPFIIIQRYNRPRLIELMRHRGLEF